MKRKTNPVPYVMVYIYIAVYYVLFPMSAFPQLTKRAFKLGGCESWVLLLSFNVERVCGIGL